MKIKTLTFIPVVLFVASLLILFHNYYSTGDFILRDIDLKGGSLIIVETDKPINTNLLETNLEQKYGSVLVSSLRTTTGYGVSIEVAATANTTDVIDDIKSLGISVSSFSVETIGPTLGTLFFQQIVYVLIVGFLLMSIVIFIIYRSVLPTFGIVFASFSNILTTLAITTLFGIKISFAGFAGLLMLIAYTVDTNIVLTSKVLRTSKEEFKKQYKKALTTGLTLIATITITMALVVFLSTSKLLVNIGEILIVGFLNDIAYTWILNAGILEMYIMRKGV
jgi:preprotein translocase subunit SecF